MNDILLRNRVNYCVIESLFCGDIYMSILKYLEPHTFVDDINKSDNYCLDKGRFCWYSKDNNIMLQSGMCLKCGNYVVSNCFLADCVLCLCDEPKEDHHGNTMMWIEYFSKK